MKENLTTIGVAIMVLFLGGLFVHVAWNAIAWAFNLPQFEYWVCVCFIGALCIICGQLGKIFTGIHNKDKGSK